MYQLTETSSVRLGNMSIPADMGNSDFQKYLAWVAEGNTADPYAPPPPPVPQVVDMAQARLALLAAGHLATVNAAIAAMPGAGGDAARIEWEFRTAVRRDSALTVAMAAVLDLDEAALDALFTSAAAL